LRDWRWAAVRVADVGEQRLGLVQAGALAIASTVSTYVCSPRRRSGTAGGLGPERRHRGGKVGVKAHQEQLSRRRSRGEWQTVSSAILASRSASESERMGEAATRADGEGGKHRPGMYGEGAGRSRKQRSCFGQVPGPKGYKKRWHGAAQSWPACPGLRASDERQRRSTTRTRLVRARARTRSGTPPMRPDSPSFTSPRPAGEGYANTARTLDSLPRPSASANAARRKVRTAAASRLHSRPRETAVKAAVDPRADRRRCCLLVEWRRTGFAKAG